jgi:hypothetical protein
MKTKEEIFNKHKDTYGSMLSSGWSDDNVSTAMDEYAKEVAIEYVNWFWGNKYNIDYVRQGVKTAKERDEVPYNLFIEHINNQSK